MGSRNRHSHGHGHEPGADERVSKSERKRQAHRLQSLGQELAGLKPADLDELPLSDVLRAAIADYQRFPSNEARRRQLQFIGRLMRDENVAPLESALETLKGRSAEAHYEFHLLERWRERLLAEPDALTEFLDEHPEADTQQLRHKIQQVHRAKNDDQQKTAYRALFRFLRDTVHPV